MISAPVTSLSINQEIYPHVNCMHAISGGRLYYIDGTGQLQLEEEFTRRFSSELSSFDADYQKRPVVFRLGYFLPIWPKQDGQPWLESATLVFKDHVLAKLQNFETNVRHFLQLAQQPLPLEKEMSAYTGMRRLIAYGSALEYYPVVAFDDMQEPVVINLGLNFVNDIHVEFQHDLKQKLLSCELFENCQVKPFLNALNTQQQLEIESHSKML